jgi:hypothetical protein
MVRLFWVELLSPAESGMDLGSTIVPYFIHVVTGMLLPLFPISVGNRDLR